MTSGIRPRFLKPLRLRPLLLGPLLLGPAICWAALDVDTLLESLAQPAPAQTPFVEIRYSKLLDTPLMASGRLEYLEDGALVRVVEKPFHERTEIRGETVSIQREGKPPRRLSLKRAPELRGMLGGFGAVLGGGRDTLERDFNVTLTGALQQWTLVLTPKSTQASRYIRDIAIRGEQSEPRCIVITQPDKQASVMLVGAAAGAALPAPLTLDRLNRFCAQKD